jgi:CRISPR-associated endonuclease/helicase Cas3
MASTYRPPRPPAGPLLAKSPRGSWTLTLLQHLRDTEQAASELFRHGTRWSRSYLRLFRLPAEAHPRFLLNLRIAALFHDIGKANEDFQAAILVRGFRTQSLRHEHLSALLLCEPALSFWLANGADVDVDVITAAVLSHHLKAAEDGDWKVLNPKHAPPTALFLDDRQVRDALVRVAEVTGIAPFVGRFPASRYVDTAWTLAYDNLFDRARRFDRDVSKKNRDRLKLMLAVKAGLIVSDSVSSGLARGGLDIPSWIEGVAHRSALLGNEIDAKIVGPRIAQLSKARPFKWHSFQEGAATLGRRGLLLAACGAGKTLAAWRWASAVSKAEEIGRVIFLYPTRGTATEGFRDYVAHAPEGEAALVHGTSKYELAGMMENPPESLVGKKVIVDEAGERLFSLALWNKRFFSATVDQFLGFLEHGYGGLCLLPALADAAIVFDEIHSYDPKMWNALMTFLERFDAPVLCMTATLPPYRRQEIERHLRTYPTPSDMSELRDLQAAEEHPRYRLSATSRDLALEAAVGAIRAGRRVLWVVNTVKRCQQTARSLKGTMGTEMEIGVYHSRFKLDDRQRRHRETVDAFRARPDSEPAPAIAVTTQVCEMSLDLDADLLVTEHAPISSLVQRFGRANRHLRRGLDFRADLLTYPPESSRPYERRDLEASSAFLADLADKDVSQRDLAAGLEKHSPGGRSASGRTAFVDGGYFATPGALRDSDDTGTPVILDGDVARYKELEKAKEPTDGLVVTVPKAHARSSDGTGLPPWLGLARSDRYDTWLGFAVDEEPNPQPGSAR